MELRKRGVHADRIRHSDAASGLMRALTAGTSCRPSGALSRTNTRPSEQWHSSTSIGTGAQKHVILYVVIVQSAKFDRYRRRVVPPVQRSALSGDAPLSGTRTNTISTFEGEDVALAPAGHGVGGYPSVG